MAPPSTNACASRDVDDVVVLVHDRIAGHVSVTNILDGLKPTTS